MFNNAFFEKPRILLIPIASNVPIIVATIEEIISVIWRSNGMGNDIFSAVIELNKIRQQAYEIYLPIVEELCNREVSEEELSHCLDYLLDFADDASMLELYKKLCRRFVYTYPGCINFYVNAYKEMWEKTEF